MAQNAIICSSIIIGICIIVIIIIACLKNNKESYVTIQHSGERLTKKSGEKTIMNVKKLLVFWSDFCKKFDIDYYVTAGTLLTTFRDGVLMPWDDDADIIVNEENYKKTLNVLSKNKKKSDIVPYRVAGSTVTEFLYRGAMDGSVLEDTLYSTSILKTQIYWQIRGNGWIQIIIGPIPKDMIDDSNILKNDYIHLDIVCLDMISYQYKISGIWSEKILYNDPKFKTKKCSISGIDIRCPDVDIISLLKKAYGKNYMKRPFCINKKGKWIKKNTKVKIKGDFSCN